MARKKLIMALGAAFVFAAGSAFAGDRVMIAYMALKMDKENPGAMAQKEAMDPAMLEVMPPEIKVQMERVKVMMATIAAASPEDKKAVAEVEDELDAYMDEQGAAHSAH